MANATAEYKPDNPHQSTHLEVVVGGKTAEEVLRAARKQAHRGGRGELVAIKSGHTTIWTQLKQWNKNSEAYKRLFG